MLGDELELDPVSPVKAISTTPLLHASMIHPLKPLNCNFPVMRIDPERMGHCEFGIFVPGMPSYLPN